MSRRYGTVKQFDVEKGFGFITPDDDTRSIFVHYSAIVSRGFKKLVAGERVAFTAEESPKGPRVVAVALIDHDPYAESNTQERE